MWRNTPPQERNVIIARAIALVRSRAEEIAQAITRENGKLIADARQKRPELAAAEADLVVLIKPQFESGPRRKAGLDQEEARRLAEETAGRLDGLSGFRAGQLRESPLLGGAGAREFLFHARRKT